jgi:hypothetical protein
MSIASPYKARLHFAVYASTDVPPWLIARFSWTEDGQGAHLELRSDLAPADQFRALSWAGAVLPGYLRPDGGGYAVLGGSIGPVLPVREWCMDDEAVFA